MRQCYLKGRYNRARYVDTYGLLSPTFTPGELYVQSPDVLRTIQSAFSELMGLYPPGTDVLTDSWKTSLALATIPSMPFTVRDADKILATLENSALPEAFEAIPVVNYEEGNLNNDANDSGCPAAWQNFLVTRELDETYADWAYVFDSVRVPVAIAMNLDPLETQDDSIYVLQEYVDTLTSKRFDGHTDFKWTFTRHQEEMFDLVKPVQLGFAFTEPLRTLSASKILRKPLAILDYKVKRKLGTTGELSNLDQQRLFMYVAHDTQELNVLWWLKPSNREIPEPTEFASMISFELFSSAECLAAAPSTECFAVELRANGKVLEFEGVCRDKGLCTYPEFMTYIGSIYYSGPHADDLELAC